VTPEFIKTAQAKTGHNLSIDRLASMKVYGVL
jgi:hypothetical protein